MSALVAFIGALFRVKRAQVHPLVILRWKVNAPVEGNLAELRREILTIAHQNGIDLHVVGEINDHGLRAAIIAFTDCHV